MVEPFAIVSTRSMSAYAQKTAQLLAKQTAFAAFADSIDYTPYMKVNRFADGEMEVTLTKSIRGRDVILFCNASYNDNNLPLEECKIELYHTVDVLQRSQARNIIVFEPFVSCSRSDRTIQRNSVGFWVHYKTLVSLGMTHFITYQLHSDKLKTAVDPVLCDMDDIEATQLLKKYICDHYIGSLEKLHTEVHNEWMFCSVDAGGEKLARRFAQAFNTQLVIAHKQRNYHTANTIDSINILSAQPLVDRVLWIVDDMIDTAASIYELICELKKHNPREINVAVVHPVLSGRAIERIHELKEQGLLKHLLVCDTISCKKAQKNITDITVVSSKKLSMEVISAIIKNEALSAITMPFSPETYLAHPRLFDFTDE